MKKTSLPVAFFGVLIALSLPIVCVYGNVLTGDETEKRAYLSGSVGGGKLSFVAAKNTNLKWDYGVWSAMGAGGWYYDAYDFFLRLGAEAFVMSGDCDKDYKSAAGSYHYEASTQTLGIGVQFGIDYPITKWLIIRGDAAGGYFDCSVDETEKGNVVRGGKAQAYAYDGTVDGGSAYIRYGGGLEFLITENLSFDLSAHRFTSGVTFDGKVPNGLGDRGFDIKGWMVMLGANLSF